MGGMKLFVTSDLHADYHTDGYERHDDVEAALRPMMQEIANCEDMPHFMFLGDLCNPYSRNTHLAAALGMRLARTLNDWDVPNYWLVGNHDVIEDARGQHTLMSIAHAGPHTVLMEEPGMVLGTLILALPFTPPSRAYDPEQVVRAARSEHEGVKIIAGHLNIEGITPGSETTDMARGREVFWPEQAVKECFPDALWLNGHYHERQVCRGIHIPGAPLRLTHGEEHHEPGYLVFDID